MLTYTNHLRKLILPEYGRNIQSMVDHALTIENREERNLCANAIIEAMMALFPPTGDKQEYIAKLWDHLLVMSDFKLDVDLPFQPVDPAVFGGNPEPLPIAYTNNIPFRHYGLHITRLIDIASQMPEGEERQSLIYLVASQMKKLLSSSSKDSVEDSKIFKDLRHLSQGAISVNHDSMILPDFRVLPAPSTKKKKKK